MPEAPVALVGFMGSGKTTVGRLLGVQPGWTYTDLDEEIEAAAGCTIREIFSRQGEAVFRRMEHEALRAALRGKPGESGRRVISLGGGAFIQAENRALLRQQGALSVFLDVPFEVLYRRCAQMTNRPLFGGEGEVRALFERRLPIYRQADVTAAATQPPEQVAERILLAVSRQNTAVPR